MPPAGPWLAAAFLIAATVLAYIPAIHGGGFVWDDLDNVKENLLLRSTHGLCDIWTKVGLRRGGTLQYYPLTYSTFWVEYHLWRLRPLGYHLINVLLHALSALLVWRILRRLFVPGALLAAAIFALHPVHVESVAFVTERKNVLSGLFYLASLLYYLRFLGVPASEPKTPAVRKYVPPAPAELPIPQAPAEDLHGYWPFYFLALFLFLCALASKTITGTLPAVILLILWWKTGRIGWRNLLLVAPMLILGLGAGLLTAYVERHQVGAEGLEWALTPVERWLVAGRAFWFYAGKLIWPSKLTFIYPRWDISQAVWWQYLFPLAAIAAIAALWMFRKKIGRGPLAAVLFFAGTLAPALGFVDVYFTRYSYVADHFQYLASLGLIALFAAVAARARSRLGPGLGKIAVPAVGTMLLTLGVLTWRQGGAYKSYAQVWIDTIEKNPSSWMAHNNLGVALGEQGRVKEELMHYREALRIKPDHVQALYNLGMALAGQGRMDEAAAQFREALRIAPDLAQAHYNLGNVLDEQGRLEEAAAQYREALRIQPEYVEAHNSLGVALAGQGRLEDAVAHFREALRIKPDYVDAQNNWGAALGKLGMVDEAVAHFRAALKISPNCAVARKNLDILLGLKRTGRSR